MSDPLFENTPHHFVSVIASFDTSGNVTPVYVRINGESFKIYNPYLISKSEPNFEYQCDIEDNGFTKQIKLTFVKRSCAWILDAKF